MKLLDALKIAQLPPEEGDRPLAISLVCGFSPLHLQTFLKAELRGRMANRIPELGTGLYGDFWGNLSRLKETESDGVAIVLEWPDLEPRLGLRSLGGWHPTALAEFAQSAQQRGCQLAQEVRALAKRSAVAISLPTLPLLPIDVTPGWQAARLELQLRADLAAIALQLGEIENVRIVNQQRLDELSPASDRLDVNSEVAAGFPYRLAHASALAEMLSRLLAGESAKKGLITDLDDTLWRGLLGEVGPQGISWDLDGHGHMHGVYQQFLRSLSDAGILVAVASKNDPSLVDEAFQRKDLVLPQNCIFPFDVSWGPKSKAVGRIAKAWNIGVDSIVFVDDSAAEIAEVQSVYPEVEGFTFAGADPQQVYQLIRRLRDLFGKDRITGEDGIRAQSMRRSPAAAENAEALADSPDSFLRQAEAELTLDFAKDPLDPRALELINKTNQFNLNGRRFTTAEWKRYIADPEVFLLLASYRDKYGPLGKIAVLTGRLRDGALQIENWVMSCRAFSRRIEYACLEKLFAKFGAGRVEIDFAPTLRNGPMQAFLEELLKTAPAHAPALSREDFLENRRETFHLVEEVSHG